MLLSALTLILLWWETNHPEPLHSWLMSRGQEGDSALEVCWLLLSELGHARFLAVLLPAVLVLGGSVRRFQDATFAALLAGIVANVVKLLVSRDRPSPGGTFSWPSGHTAAMTAIAVALAGWRPSVTVGGWLGTLGVALGRVMRGRHWPGDVAAGWVVGGLCGMAVRRAPTLLPAWLEERRTRRWLAGILVAGWVGWLLIRPTASEVQPLLTLLPVLACWHWLCNDLGNDASVRAERWRTAGDVLLFLLVFAVGRTGATGLALLDVDEPRFAAASRTMLETGDWIVPWFNGAERFDKPVLIYWLQMAAMAWFGPTASAARLPSALGVALAAVATAGLGRRFGLPTWAAALAGLMAGTAPIAQGMAHGATADGLLYGIVTGLAWLQVRRAADGTRPWVWWAMWSMVGLAFLTKGPPAMVGPLALGLGLWWAGARPRWRSIGGGILLAAAIVAAWAIPALVRTEGGFFTRGIMHHVVARAARPFEGHGGYAPWWLLFFFWTTPLALLPWSWLLPWCYATLRHRPRMPVAPAGERWARRSLLGWIAGVFGTFTLVVSKLPHYVLPSFPALAIATMLGCPTTAAPWLGRLLCWSGVLLGCALPVALGVSGFTAAVPGASVVGFAFAYSSCRAGALLRQGRSAVGVAVLGIGVVLSMMALFGRVVPHVDAHLLGRTFAAQLPRLLQAEDTLHLYRMVAPSATFYAHRITPEVAGPEDVLQLLQQPGHLVLMRESEANSLQLAAARLAETGVDVEAALVALRKPLWRAEAFHTTKGKVVAVQICGRHRS